MSEALAPDSRSRIPPGTRGFIFDMDGTLVDTQVAHYRAWDRATREHDFDYTEEEITCHFGKTTPEIAKALFSTRDLGFIATISEKKADYFIEESIHATPFDGVTAILERIATSGWVSCIASSNVRRAIDGILGRTGLARHFSCIVSLDDIKRGKPDPEMILLASARLRLAPDECVVIGDTVYDMLAGSAAGAFTIGVLTGTTSKKALANAGASIVLDGVKDMLGLLEVDGS